MIKNDAGLYAAFKAKDTRFDGHFFVGVSSTGIYCRPICHARMPKAENCTYFSTAAEAEQAGYRPCLLCRPELSPGASIANTDDRPAYRAARLIEATCGNGHSLAEIAQRLGCTDRHLRRIFTEEYHVSPIRYLQTCRLLLAKNLLIDTDLTVLDIAMTAGFGSLRRFNDGFKKHYGLTPTALRKHREAGKKRRDHITLLQGYRPPYPWKEMLNFLEKRAIKGVEVIKNGTYTRTVSLRNAEGKPAYGWLRVCDAPQKNALSVTLSETLLPVLPQALARVQHLFDLSCDPHAIYEVLKSMNRLQPGLCALGTRVPGCFDSFETAVRAVLGQQVTIKAANTLTERIVKKFGTPAQTGIPDLDYIFPSPDTILGMGEAITTHFGELGVISARSKTIYELAKALSQGEVQFDPCAQAEKEIENLKALRGIGSWTAQYIAMRVLKWPDAFLETDVGIKKALPAYPPKELLKIAEAWRPWRSYATVNLWNTL